MARSTPPKLVGQIQSNKAGLLGYEVWIWELPGGHTRVEVKKGTQAPKKGTQGGRLLQLPLPSWMEDEK